LLVESEARASLTQARPVVEESAAQGMPALHFSRDAADAACCRCDAAALHDAAMLHDAARCGTMLLCHM
jgi:hypothetical protein